MCGCAAVCPLVEAWLAGGAKPLRYGEGTRSCEEEPWLKHCRGQLAGIFSLNTKGDFTDRTF